MRGWEVKMLKLALRSPRIRPQGQDPKPKDIGLHPPMPCAEISSDSAAVFIHLAKFSGARSVCPSDVIRGTALIGGEEQTQFHGWKRTGVVLIIR